MTNGEKYLKSLRIQLEVTRKCSEALEAAFDIMLVQEAKEMMRFLKKREDKIISSIRAYEKDIKNGLTKEV